jgi:hypothetical protein
MNKPSKTTQTEKTNLHAVVGDSGGRSLVEEVVFDRFESVERNSVEFDERLRKVSLSALEVPPKRQRECSPCWGP